MGNFMKIRLHIKGSELKHLHNNPKKQFHIVTFTARLEPEDYIELLKTDGIIQVECRKNIMVKNK